MRPRRAALVFIFITVVLDMLALGMIIPVLPTLVVEFTGGDAARGAEMYGLFGTVWALMQFVFSPVLGALSDRFGRRPVILLSNFGLGLDYILMAAAPTLAWLFLGRVLSGITAASYATAGAYIADVTPPERRAAGFGLLGAAFGLGFILGPGMGGLLAQASEGRLAFQIPLFAAALLSGMAALGVVAFVRESRTHAPPNQPPWVALGDALADPVISRVLLVSIIYMAGFSGMEACFGLWAEDRFDWGAPEVGWCFMAVGIVASVTQGMLTGRLARRFGEAPMLTFGVLLFGVTLFLQTVNSVQLVVPALMAVGAFGMSNAMPNIAAIISQSSPPGRQGAMLGLNMASGAGARVIGPVVAGVIYSGLGHNWPFWLGAALTVPAAVVAMNAGRIIRARRAGDTALAF